MNPITLFLVVVCLALGGFLVQFNLPIGVVFIVLGVVIALSLKMANTWQRFVILRAGHLHGVKGPGLFLIFPIIDNIVAVIDERIQTTSILAESALTRDTVPVNVDAIIFWKVHNAEAAALTITNYREAIDRISQTSLREMIGATPLSVLLSDRQAADQRLSDQIAAKTKEWGITVLSVEIRDVAIPVELQDAMSRQAQAEREKEARVILGSAEAEVAAKFVEAARTYASDPAALQLRAMNIIYETTKERWATILMPSAMVDAMDPSGPLGMVIAASGGLDSGKKRAAPAKTAVPTTGRRRRKAS
ncbi:MAG TPA: slipin family protein [Caulobacteraceae bacterium]|nr:slipin family protein [Caulobacteraceae bacterium]